MLWLLVNGKRSPSVERSFSDIAPVNSILCGDLAIKAIEEPFISDADDGEEWAI